MDVFDERYPLVSADKVSDKSPDNVTARVGGSRARGGWVWHWVEAAGATGHLKERGPHE